MIKPFFYIIILFLFILTVTTKGFAQQQTTIKASVDRNKILIGEPIQLKLEVMVPENQSIRFFNIDSIPHFEFLQMVKTDTANTSKGTKLTRVIPITSFDSGHWVIPSFVLSENLATDTIPVDVGFTPFDPEQDYHDIKDIIEAKPAKNKEQWWWYAAAGGILLLVLLIYLLRKKNQVVVTKPQLVINAYEEALEQMNILQKESPGSKLFHSRLTDIFRLYVFRKKGVLSLQKTTDDLVLQLSDLNLGSEQFQKLSQTLRLSDFVKFAKYDSSKDENSTSFETILSTIKAIEKSTSHPA